MTPGREPTPAATCDPAEPLPRDRFRWITEPLDHWAAETPDGIAAADPLGTRSFAQLRAEVDRVADLLARHGVRPGDRVMILLENSLAAAISLFATVRLKAWAVPLNARLSAREVDTIRDHCKPGALVYCAGVSPDAEAHAARHGATPEPALEPLGALMASGGGGDPEPVSDDPADQVGALIYTSGTTGAPKGVMLTHDNLMFLASRSSETRGITRADRVYAVLPMSHVFGLSSVMLGSLYQGARLDLVPRFVPEEVARALAEDGITIFQGVPQIYARLMAFVDATGATLPAPALRYISAGGAPLDVDLKRRVEAMWHRPLHNGYGQTETSPTISTTEIDRPSGDDSCGPPLPDVEVRIAGPKGAALPQGEVGEIWARGRLVMRGYYRDPKQTAEVLTPEGWLKTGDLGRLSPEGELYVVGRLKELIIRSGFNVYPPEVEAVLASHPDVALAAVVGRPVEGNEEVVAFVQPVPGREIDGDALRAYVEAELAPYKRPSEYIVKAELPATSTGKLLKAKLKEMV
ncbi:MAG: class I adenylate-forming enzyme family protein [Alphaproteobacteria bacterium]|nr:class I adenylate-forming enzyme family protein [Alphaproteobacteria bacterium]